jgi:hypothetical protein
MHTATGLPPVGTSPATITLDVHPRHGETVSIGRGYGPDSVWVELADGRLTVLPKRWTSLVPRPRAQTVGGTAVRLDLEAARALAAWVAARREPQGGQVRKVDPGSDPGEKDCGHGGPESGAADGVGATPLVGQVGAASAGRGGAEPEGEP